jgi:CHAT domain-containing protein
MALALLVPLPRISNAEQPQPPPVEINLATTLFKEAEALRAEQRQNPSEQAMAKYREAAEMFRKHDDLLSAARSLRCAGEMSQALGDSRAALDSYQEAIPFSHKAKDLAEEARLLNDIAYANFLEGNSNAAKDNSLSALRIAEQLSDRALEANALSNLGEAFYNLGEIATAEEHQERALEIFSSLNDPSGRSRALTALGWYQSFQTKPLRAIECFNEAFSAASSANDLRLQALALSGLANVTAKFGNKQQALTAYIRARELVDRTGDRINLGSILGGTAAVHFSMGDTESARRLIEQAIAGFELINSTWGVAEAKMDLGRIYHSLGENEKALLTLKEALRLFRSLGMRRVELHALREIGRVQHSLGDLHGALRTLKGVLARIGSDQDQRYKAYTLAHIGAVFESLKDSNQALAYYQQALPLSNAAGDPAGESTELFHIARLERDRGELALAQQHVESAIAIDESLRSDVSSHDLRATFLASVRDVYELYIDVLFLRHKMNPNAGFAEKGFGVSERARARSFLDSLQESKTDIREGVDPALLEKEQTNNQALNEKRQQQANAAARKDKDALEAVRNETERLATEATKIRDQIRASSPKYAALTLPEPLKLTDAQQLLDDDSILLEYALGDPRSYVWVVSRNWSSVHQLPARAEIEASAKRVHDLFVACQAVAGESVTQRDERENKANQELPIAAATLSKLVLAPIAGSLGNKRLLIVADGALQYIPFQSLSDPDSTTEFLIAKHELIYQPSASALAAILSEARERRAASNTVAVFADPVFELNDPRVKRGNAEPAEQEQSKEVRQALRDVGLTADGVEIPRLLASRDEAEAIMSAAPSGGGLKATGFEASRQRVLTGDLNRYRIVHFATHGLINNEHPEMSGIVLSLLDEQGRSQDGFLRLHDIYNLHLSADLVVLSACSTGLGKDIKGEGLVGLTRGFMYAGASSVVASLWKVDDNATAELMKHFYQAMFTKQLTPAAALREAQLQMSRDKRWSAPYYWAGFVIQGRYDVPVVVNESRLFSPRRIALGVGLILILTITSIFLLRRRRA